MLETLLNQITWLSPFNSIVFYNNSLTKYLFVLGGVLLVYLLGKFVSFIFERHASKLTSWTNNKIDDMILAFMHRSVTFILVLAALYSGLKWLTLPEQIYSFAHKSLFIVLIIKLAVEVERLVEFFVTGYLLPIARKQRGFVKTFIPPLLHFSKFMVWSLAFLLVINNLGYNISSLIAGLGIGGIALALAAQETLGNAFGSISILTDQPFKLNDVVQIGGHIGFVREVGMRSTRLELLTGEMLTIPNKTVANETISNFSQRKRMGVKFTLGLEYGTPKSTLENLLKELPKVIKKNKHVDAESVRVHFTDFGDSSLHLEIYYVIINPKFKYADYLSAKESVNLKIMDLANGLNADLAFPTQSIFIKNAAEFSKTLKN